MCQISRVETCNDVRKVCEYVKICSPKSYLIMKHGVEDIIHKQNNSQVNGSYMARLLKKKLQVKSNVKTMLIFYFMSGGYTPKISTRKSDNEARIFAKVSENVVQKLNSVT